MSFVRLGTEELSEEHGRRRKERERETTEVGWRNVVLSTATTGGANTTKETCHNGRAHFHDDSPFVLKSINVVILVLARERRRAKRIDDCASIIAHTSFFIFQLLLHSSGHDKTCAVIASDASFQKRR